MKIEDDHRVFEDDEEYYRTQALRSKPREDPGHGRLLWEINVFLDFLNEAKFHNPKILDAGCRDGWLQDVCPQVAIGVECVQEVVDYACSRGRNVLFGDLDKLLEVAPGLYAGKKFDGVFMSHCLEHVRNPQLALQRLSELLTPGGLVYLIVPTSPSFSNPTHVRAIPNAVALLGFIPDSLKLIYYIEYRKEFRAMLQTVTPGPEEHCWEETRDANGVQKV